MVRVLGLCGLLALGAAGGEVSSSVLVLKNGQRIGYESLVREGETLFLRVGGNSLVIDASEVALAPVAAGGEFVPGKEVPEPVARLIGPNAGRHNLRPELIQAVMEVESGYQVRARSRVGAIGLMQLMPQTARHLGVNAHDPAQNVEGGARLLDMLVTKYEGRPNGLALALAAYNAGAGAVDRYGGIPPYRETRGYVKKVLRRFRELVNE
ncbi:MAG: lytic transglycosylase domain-containing protein [Acidobacteria bacterium]|jgi:soluble lytic murein transglycosylase-like protein|nr:lytic transglycosylase domain-containing protein [Acidobacteriota bacterium]